MLGCDECSMCCRLIAVEEIDKPRDTTCRHAVPGFPGGGCCSLHPAQGGPGQPVSCRLFFCGWLASQRLKPKNRMPPSMRPDRSGVVIGPCDEKDPNVLYVNVDPDRPDAWTKPEPLAYLNRYVRNGVRVTLHVGDASAKLELGSRAVKFAKSGTGVGG